MQRAKGAKPVRDRLDGLLDELERLATDGRRVADVTEPKAVFAPHASQEQWREARRLFAEILAEIGQLRQVIDQQVEPFFKRAAPDYDQRLKELEERIKALEQQGPPRMQLLSKERGTGG